MVLQFPRLKTLLMTFLFVIGHGPPPVRMIDFETIKTAAFTAVTDGISFDAYDKKDMKQHNFGVTVLVIVENWTRYRLTQQNLNVRDGYSFHVSTDPSTIEPCKREVLVMGNLPSTSSYGTVSWLVSTGDRRFVLMWSALLDNDIYKNWMGLGLTSNKYTDTSWETLYYDTMYYSNSNTTNLAFTRKEFDDDENPVMLSDDQFQPLGVMSTGHEVTVRVAFKPVYDNDLAPEILRELQQASELSN
uniref:Coluporin-14 n=1 Tax=Colubraria reticulata TaxID=604273 RepID=A0A499RN87_9CAEN|nr:coluporin-14 [Colubraria reticulata]